MSKPLDAKRIAFLATDGFEQVEFTQPWRELREAGAGTELVSLASGTVQGFNHLDKADIFHVDRVLSEADPGDYDGLVLPGGVANPDALRMNDAAVDFVKHFVEADKPIAAICHGPWTLVEADAVRNRTLTSWPSLRTDIRNAGGHWVDEEVHVDGRLVTSRNPGDLDAFCSRTIEEFKEGRHEGAAA